MKYLILLASLNLFFVSCKKKETTTTPIVLPATPLPKVAATFTVESYDSDVQAVAQFNYIPAINAGSVFVNNFYVPYPTYVYYSTGTVNVINPVVWNIQGGGGAAAQTVTVDNMPDMPISTDIDTSKIVTGSQGYTIHNQAITCDSIEYQMSYMNVRNVSGNSTSMTFNPADFTNYNNGGGNLIRVAVSAYNSYVVMVGNDRRRFISKTTFYKNLHYKP